MDSIVSTRELVEAVNSYNDVTLLDSIVLEHSYMYNTF